MSLINLSNSSLGSLVILNFSNPAADRSSLDDSLVSQWIVQVIKGLGGLQQRVNEALPNWFFQTKIDDLTAYLEGKFASFRNLCQRKGVFNGLEYGEIWYKQIATDLCKLPLRVAYSIINQFHKLIEKILNIGAHPLIQLIQTSQDVLSFLLSLISAENWKILGSQILGASLSQSCFIPHVVPWVMIGLGVALLMAGVSKELLDTMMRHQPSYEQISGDALIAKKIFDVSTTLATAFVTGALMSQIPGLNSERALTLNRRFEIPLVPTKVEIAGIIPLGMPSV